MVGAADVIAVDWQEDAAGGSRQVGRAFFDTDRQKSKPIQRISSKASS
jgi:hypothetical protein